MTTWKPDVPTFHWALANIDELAVADGIVAQIGQRCPDIAAVDRALLGEAAAESVLFWLITEARTRTD